MFLSTDDASSPEYPYTPMKLTTSYIKPVLMRLTRGFVLKTRRYLTSTNDVSTMKVFINVYSGQITGFLSHSDSVQQDSEGFRLYLFQKMSNVSDRSGNPSLLFHVAFDGGDIESYKEAYISHKVSVYFLFLLTLSYCMHPDYRRPQRFI